MSDSSAPLQGVKIRRNKKNKYVIFELHYGADPAKRSAEWKESAQSGIPLATWEQEYEITWDSFSGMPVYRDFSKQRHLAKEKPEAWIGLPMLRGWDFGLTPSIIIAQMQKQQLVVFKEYCEVNMGAEQFCELVLPQVSQAFPGAQWIDFADPAGVAKAQSDETSCFDVLAGFGVSPICGPVAFTKRREAVEHFLTRRTRDGECFQIWEAGCEKLVKGFKGGYRYPEKARDVEPLKLRPIKDQFSHPHDALQYIAGGIREGNLRRSEVVIPTLRYFQGATT